MLNARTFLIIIPVLLGVFMISNPQESLAAARDGFLLWYSVLLPALLPFFMVAELLASSGFIHFMGRLLEPIMQPVFRLPGCASLVIVMGFTSGFPVGAILSRRLYQEGLLSGEQTERLVSFTNNSSPLFVIGAVGAGLFGSSHMGYVLAIAHYLSNFLLGIVLRFRKAPAVMLKNEIQLTASEQVAGSIGQMLSSAIKNSLNNIIAIAGFVIFFSVLTRMLVLWGFIDWLALFISKVLTLGHLPSAISYAMSMGLFEISIGTRAVSLAPQSDLLCKMLVASTILAFSGLSIIAQVTGLLADTPVRPGFYVFARLIQIALAIPITVIAYCWLPAPQAIPSMSTGIKHALYSIDAWGFSMECLILCLLIMIVLIMIGLLQARE